MKTALASVYEDLAAIVNQLVESFAFDTKLLNSSFRDTIDETYEEVFNNSKNHNPRNNPELHDEIRKELIAYMNRPGAAKLWVYEISQHIYNS